MKSFRLRRPMEPTYPNYIRKALLGQSKPIEQSIVELTGFRVHPESVQNYLRKYEVLTEKYNTALPDKCGQRLLCNS